MGKVLHNNQVAAVMIGGEGVLPALTPPEGPWPRRARKTMARFFPAHGRGLA